MIKKIDKIISTISTAGAYVSCVLISAIMFLICIDVFLRKVFRFSIAGSYEIVECLLMLVVFTAFAMAQTRKGHIHVTVFISKFPRIPQTIINGILGLISFVAAFFCAYALWYQAMYSMNIHTVTSVLYMPLYPFYFVSSVCVYIFAVTLLWDAIKSLMAVKNDETYKEMRKGWD